MLVLLGNEVPGYCKARREAGIRRVLPSMIRGRCGTPRLGRFPRFMGVT